MTTNTNAAQVANNLIAVAEDQAFEAWYKQDCLVGGVNARIAARAAWNARAALTTAAAQPPADGALNTIAAMFHSGEEIEGPDGLAMMVDMSVWNDALDAFDEISGDDRRPLE